jgi:hypothetical protein
MQARMLGDDQRIDRGVKENPTHHARIGMLTPLARFLHSLVRIRPRAGQPTIEETDMSKLTIDDLPIARELDKQQMTGVSGGMGRTPQQILAWEMTGKPATWQGLVLDDDNRLHVPTI